MRVDRLAEHGSRPRIEGGKQREGSVTKVLESMPLGSTRRKRKNRVQPIKGLNRSLLIDAKYSCMLGRVEIQANNVGSNYDVASDGRFLMVESMSGDAAATRTSSSTVSRIRGG